jgi:hypothetical protein
VRLLAAKDVFINQSPTTGEAVPIERSAGGCRGSTGNPFGLANATLHGQRFAKRSDDWGHAAVGDVIQGATEAQDGGGPGRLVRAPQEARKTPYGGAVSA